MEATGNRGCWNSKVGAKACLQRPGNLPAEAVSAVNALVLHMATFETGKDALDCEGVHNEVMTVLAQSSGPMLVCQLGARLRPEARLWLRSARVKLHAFLSNDPRYVVDNDCSRETVRLAEAASPLTRKDSCTSMASVSTSSGSTVNSHKAWRPSPVAAVMHLLLHEPNLCTLLQNALPTSYEE